MKKEPKADQIVKGFLGYLSDTHQSVLLPTVTKELDQLVDIKEKAGKGIVTSVLPLTPSQMTTVQHIVKKIFRHNVTLTQAINKNLLGGFTIKVGDWFVDGSVAHDIEELKRVVLT